MAHENNMPMDQGHLSHNSDEVGKVTNDRTFFEENTAAEQFASNRFDESSSPYDGGGFFNSDTNYFSNPEI